MKESKRCEGTLFLGHFFIGGGKPASSVKVNNIFGRAKSEETRSYGVMAFVSSFLGVWYEI